MRVILAALCFVFFSLPAHAYWTTDASGSGGAAPRAHGTVGSRITRSSHHYQHPEITHYAQRSLGLGDCAEAARQGGPCGCMVMRIVGLTDRKFWAVSAYLSLPRTTPHPGAIAIWRGRHVEVVSNVNGDGTVSTRGSVGFSRVPIGRLTFVEPH